MTTVDTRKDLLVDSDRDIQLDGGGDLMMTRNSDEYLANYLAVSVGDLIRRLIGEPTSGSVLEAARSGIEDAINENEQFVSVLAVDITEIDKTSDTVTIHVETVENTDFELEVSA